MLQNSQHIKVSRSIKVIRAFQKIFGFNIGMVLVSAGTLFSTQVVRIGIMSLPFKLSQNLLIFLFGVIPPLPYHTAQISLVP